MGYLGHTATGDLVVDYSNTNQFFVKKELDYIKNTLGINTGSLYIVDYEELETWDKVILYFSEKQELRYLNMVTIYREGRYLYAIQDKYAGESTLPRYQDNLPYSIHSLLCDESPDNDHRKLHLYIEGKEPLKYDFENEYEIKDDLDYNLPLDLLAFNLRAWKDHNPYITDNLYFDDTKLKEADFSIVLMLDDILKEEFKSTKKITSERTEAKMGHLN